MTAKPRLRIGLCQIDTVPGDVAGNVARIRAAAERAGEAGADLAVFPEMAVEGYSPRDLLFRPSFLEASERALAELAPASRDLPLLVGTVLPAGAGRRPLHNGAVLLAEGREAGRFLKTLLPDYDVFDEARYFEPGEPASPFELLGWRVGVTICEDVWAREPGAEVPRYDVDPASVLAAAGADVVVNLSASPYHRGRPGAREEVVRRTAVRSGLPVLLCNLVGANDEIVFDGGSVAIGGDGTTWSRAAAFEEDLLLVELPFAGPPAPAPAEDAVGNLHDALVLGVRDYAAKCGFDTAVIGVSGGVDSAVTAVVAREALGAERLTAMALPSEFSSRESEEDARDLADRLGIDYHVVPIQEAYSVLVRLMEDVVGQGPFGVMEENIQARIRGLLLMAFSNRTGSLLLSTGNKSEMAVGYCTLYGDMSGGLAVIGDVYKTDVYRLAARYAARGLVPERVVAKPPSAELRPDQKDSDTLPPYDRLDPVLRLYIEEGLGSKGIRERLPDVPLEEIRRVLRMVAGNEYKRKQAAPALRVSPKAFGYGRRIPIVASHLSHLQLD